MRASDTSSSRPAWRRALSCTSRCPYAATSSACSRSAPSFAPRPATPTGSCNAAELHCNQAWRVTLDAGTSPSLPGWTLRWKSRSTTLRLLTCWRSSLPTSSTACKRSTRTRSRWHRSSETLRWHHRSAYVFLTTRRYEITPFQFKKWPERNVRLTYIEALNILREAGEDLGDYDDINTAQEKKLGAIVKQRFGTDFFSVHRLHAALAARAPQPSATCRFPDTCRPFYTMPAHDDANWTNRCGVCAGVAAVGFGTGFGCMRVWISCCCVCCLRQQPPQLRHLHEGRGDLLRRTAHSRC